MAAELQIERPPHRDGARDSDGRTDLQKGKKGVLRARRRNDTRQIGEDRRAEGRGGRTQSDKSGANDPSNDFSTSSQVSVQVTKD